MRREILKKKIALLLVCMMVFSLFGTNLAFAEDQAANIEGSVKQIASAADFPTEIAAGETYELAADITLSAEQQITTLAGTLDGKGHTITLSGKALADTIGETGIVQNLGVTGNLPTDYTAAYAMHFKGVIQNCFSKVATTGLTEISGFVADIQGGTIQNSWFSGNEGFGAAFVYQGAEGTLNNLICQNSGYGGIYAGTNDLMINNVKKIGDEVSSWNEAIAILNTDRPDTGYKWKMGTREYPVLIEDSGTEEPETVNKTALEKTITAAESKTEADYTQDSWQVFQTALSSAQEIKSKDDATQAEVDAAVSALQKAIDSLQKIKPLKPVQIPDDAIKISTVSDLESIGTGEEKYYVLENDITIKQSDWYFAINEFQGVFDGKGYTITFEKSGGLFGGVGTDGIVQNVHFTGTVSGNGPLGQTISGAVINCYSDTEESNSAGFANKLDGGVLANCYSTSAAKNGAIVNLYGENTDGNTYTGTFYNTYWRSDLKMPSISAGDLKKGSGAKSEAEMQSKLFVDLLNTNRGEYGTSWGLNKETGYPYFGEDQSETLPESQYPIVFTEIGKNPIQDENQALRVFVGSSGSFSLAGAPEKEITWELKDASPEGCMTLDGATLRADKEGSAVLTASAINTQGEKEIVTAATITAVTRQLESITLTISGDENNKYIKPTDDGKYEIDGSAYAKINISEKYEGDDTVYTGNIRDYSITSSDESKALPPMGSEVQFKEPGTAVMTVTSKKNAAVFAKVELTSTYVAVTAVKPGISGTHMIHGRNANDWESSPERFNPEYLGVDIQPANASYKDREYVTITSSDENIGVYHNLAYIPVGAGTVTYTATVRDPQGAEVSGSSTVTYAYKNPLKALSVDGKDFTLKANEAKTLPLTFTGEKDNDGWSITDPVIDWSYSEEGIAEIHRKQSKAYKKADEKAPDYTFYVLDTEYVLTGIKEGTVTVTGTPRDKTHNLKPITFTVTVSGSEALPEIDIPATIEQGMKDAISYIQLNHTDGYTYNNNDWAVQALISAGKTPTQAQLDSYYASVENTVKAWSENQKPTDIARVVLALAAMKKDVTNVGGKNLAAMIYNHPDLDAGSNELAWALIALDASKSDVPQDATWSKNAMIKALLEFQNSDGGFALSKTETDSSVDITAMTLQALAPYENTNDNAKKAIEVGLDFLKSKLSSGINPGYGTCEAEAQVILTLAVLKKDVTAAGFGDVYRNLFSHLEENYKNATGGYKHQANDAVSQEMSTVQVLQAYDAYNRFLNKQSSYWDFGNGTVIPGEETQAEDVIAAIAKIADTSKLTLSDEETVKAVRALYNALSEEEKAKVDEANLAKLTAAETKIAELKAQSKEITVQFTLLGDKKHDSDADKEVHNLESGNLETWIATESITVEAGASVRTVLEKALKAHGYKATYTNGGDYVSAITTPDGFTLSEFDNGKNSGWKYNVNGSYPDKALTAYKVSNGENIIWCYTDNYKKDAGYVPEDPGDTDIDDPDTPLDPGTEAVKSMVSSMKLTARSARTSKKNVKVTITTDKATTSAVKELKEMGYTVKYTYFRSTKKASGYKAMLTKKTKTYTNTIGKKGKMYYYKAQIRVYDKDGKLAAKTMLKQCKYANRIWKK